MRFQKNISFAKHTKYYKISLGKALRIILLAHLSFYTLNCSDPYSEEYICNESAILCEDTPLPESNHDIHQASTSQGKPVTRKKITLTNNRDKLDILFVMDNSRSMTEEQEIIANQFNDLFDEIADMNYQIAIITTDVDSSMKGQFLPFASRETFLSNRRKKSTTHQANKTLFQNIIRTGHNGSLNEQGIAALNKRLDEEKNSPSDFFREHSLLMVIIVSDEDEKNDGINLDYINLPEIFFKKVNELKFSKYSSVIVHSIIWKPEDSQSTCPSGLKPGKTYARASNPEMPVIEKYGNILKGHIGSVCSADYNKQLGSVIEHTIKNYPVTLPCFPHEDMSVEMKGKKIGFIVKGRKVFLKNPVSKGKEVQFSFYCKKYIEGV